MCRVCSAEHSGRTPKNRPTPYCSQQCRAAAARAKRPSKREHVCRGCSKTFMAPVGKRQKGHYCTRACAYAHIDQWIHRVPKRPARQMALCIECGKTTTRTAPSYCSDECRKSAASRKAKERAMRAHDGKVCRCSVCGNAFTASYGTKKRRFCSDVCLARGKSLHKQGRNHRERARHHGVFYEPVSKRKVMVRDNWTCAICGDPIDPRAKWPDMMCASLDHIVPMSKGGPHTYGNVQAAHNLCNSYKGTDEGFSLRVG